MKWSDFANIVADGAYNHITTSKCLSYFNTTDNRGIKAVIALTPDLSVSDGGNDAILSVPGLEGTPTSMSTGAGYGAGPVDPFKGAVQGDQILASKYGVDEISLYLDGGLVFDIRNSTSVEWCRYNGGKQSTCAHAAEVMEWIKSGPSKTITGVRNYMNAHKIRDIRAKNTFLCSEGGSFDSFTTPWHPYTVDGCLMFPAEQHCRLMYSPPICIVVAVTTLVKVVCMFFAARISRTQPVPLLTLGDAVASFITNPDPTTAGMCWISGTDIHRGNWKMLNIPPLVNAGGVPDDSWKPAVVIYKRLSHRKRWMRASNIQRSLITIVL